MDPDEAVIAELIARGSNPANPHELDFYFFLPDRESCNSLADALSSYGLRIDILEPDGDTVSFWAVQGWLEIPLDHERIRDLCIEFRHIASQMGGKFDGWGAEVVK